MAKWEKLGTRGKVSDRRGVSGGVAAGGIGTVILLMGVTYLMGGSPVDVLLQTDPSVFTQQSAQEDLSEFAGEDEYEIFTSTVLGSNNVYWEQTLAESGILYTEPSLVLFRDSTNSACGGAQSYIGPHYCPADQTIYLDETFFAELQGRLGATGGDVAEAYVISHEVGHHVQNILDILSGRQTNQDSVRVELQADCFAGLWASSLKGQGVFEKNEILEAMDAAAAVGDDRIQQKTSGEINSESWTHGSSDQRVAAFTTGYDTGDLALCVE
jgi:predicted metalloprotease